MSYYNSEHYPDPTAWQAQQNIDRQAGAAYCSLAVAEKEAKMETIIFRVPGPPQGKGRPRFTTAGGFTRSYTPAKTREYEDYIAARFRSAAGGLKLLPPIRVDVLAIYGVPKSYTKQRRQECMANLVAPTTKPDVDNILKAVLDALNKIAFEDDCQVSTCVVTRRYGDPPGLVVKITGNVEAEQMQLEKVGG